MKTTHFCQKWPNDVILGQKWRHMSKISRDTTKIFFSNYSKHQVEQLFFWQFSLKTTLKGWKLLIFVKNGQITSFWTKNDVIRRKLVVTRQKFFLQIIQNIKWNNFFTDSLALKRLWRNENYSFFSKMAKKRHFGPKRTPKMTS